MGPLLLSLPGREAHKLVSGGGREMGGFGLGRKKVYVDSSCALSGPLDRSERNSPFFLDKLQLSAAAQKKRKGKQRKPRKQREKMG